ncbi:MAG: hypothetical protein K0S09_3059 [Sphingobacteriaceae bacterium]|nr:hypothetical protein [Sphingobacteriaceae bacterium]
MRRLFILTGIIAIFGCIAPMPSTAKVMRNAPLYTTSDTLTTDTLIKFAARSDLGFNFEYLVYLPKGLSLKQTTRLLVETNNSGANDSMEYQEKGARYSAAKSSVGNYVSRKLKLPLLVPIFPRSETNWMYYTHALDRDALLCKDFGIERLDQQLLAMISDAKKQLVKAEVRLKDRFFITGFSASGTFANRFSLLHPENVQATASGGINAIAILPVTELQGKPLKYPLGIADLYEITGKTANLQAFQKLPKLLYMGEKDENDAAAFDDAYSEEERALIYGLMGKQMIPHRWEFMRQVYQSSQVEADFRTYPNMGHRTDLKINNDLVDFFKKHLN